MSDPTATPSLVNSDPAAPAVDPAAPAAPAPAVVDPAAPAVDPAAPAKVEPTEAEKAAAATAEKEKLDKAVADAIKARVPEKYEFKAPEGTELSPEMVTAFEPVAKELGLSQEQAQKLVDLQANFASSQVKAAQEHWANTFETWRSEAKADKEYGGVNFDQNLGLAKTALDKLGTPALREVLDKTGMGNHPEIIRMLVKAGKMVSEDGAVSGNTGGGAPKTAADILFPNLPKG